MSDYYDVYSKERSVYADELTENRSKRLLRVGNKFYQAKIDIGSFVILEYEIKAVWGREVYLIPPNMNCKYSGRVVSWKSIVFNTNSCDFHSSKEDAVRILIEDLESDFSKARGVCNKWIDEILKAKEGESERGN